jgi:hypothetical protein
MYDVRAIVRREALEGLIFEEVWSNDDAAETA